MEMIERIDLNSAYGKHMTYQIYTIVTLLVATNESRHLLTKFPVPKLTWYYSAFEVAESRQAILSVFDVLEDRKIEELKPHAEQIDYYNIHKEYLHVKKRALTSFLENERKALNNNFNKRANEILVTVSNFENQNIRKKLSEIAENSLNSVISKINNPNENKEILDASFESALVGLREGKMEYQGDLLLPMYLEELKKNTNDISNLTPQEEDQLFALTSDQRKQVIAMDNRNKAAYLSKKPELAASVTNSKVYEGIVRRMKDRVESSIKF